MNVRFQSVGWGLGTLLVAAVLQGCGGGSASDPEVPPVPVVITSPVLAAVESSAVQDSLSTYATELDRVLVANVVTTDGTYTFADVNADTDDTDAIVPEIDAHVVMEDYPDDGLVKNANLRLRGSSTRLSEQKSYRVKLTSSVPMWRGERTLQFNKHPFDLTRMRNKLAFDLFRHIPHIASLRTQFVHMTITNKNALGVQYATGDFGLFTHVEKMGEEYLANRGLPTDGNVYKVENFEFRYSDKLAIDATGKILDKDKFEQVLNLEVDNKNHKPLIAMIDDVNNLSIPFDTTFAKYFDKSNYLTWLASNILLGNRDTTNQNFGLYQPKSGDKFYFVPWDYDGAFGFEDQPDQKAAGALYAPWQKTVSNWWDVPLHQRFLQDPVHLAELKLAVAEIYAAYLTDDKIKAKVDRYKALVEPYVAKLPDSRFLPVLSASPLAEWEAERVRIAAVIKNNHDVFAGSLEAPMPFWQAAEMEAGQVRLRWDAAYDLQGDAVTYTVQTSSTPDFRVLTRQTVTSGTTLLIPKPANGVFYLKVTAKDSKGNLQSAFDRFDAASGVKYFGVSAHVVSATAVTPVE